MSISYYSKKQSRITIEEASLISCASFLVIPIGSARLLIIAKMDLNSSNIKGTPLPIILLIDSN